ncbi:MAG: hypothetical protein HS120_02200 [Burkholderiales bacterium]|nr:hypothetical protein [Burkholderiales bacterium]
MTALILPWFVPHPVTKASVSEWSLSATGTECLLTGWIPDQCGRLSDIGLIDVRPRELSAADCPRHPRRHAVWWSVRPVNGQHVPVGLLFLGASGAGGRTMVESMNKCGRVIDRLAVLRAPRHLDLAPAREADVCPMPMPKLFGRVTPRTAEVVRMIQRTASTKRQFVLRTTARIALLARQ